MRKVTRILPVSVLRSLFHVRLAAERYASTDGEPAAGEPYGAGDGSQFRSVVPESNQSIGIKPDKRFALAYKIKLRRLPIPALEPPVNSARVKASGLEERPVFRHMLQFLRDVRTGGFSHFANCRPNWSIEKSIDAPYKQEFRQLPRQ